MKAPVKSRNYGIDALRILSMFLIPVLHVLGNGGILNAAKPLSLQYEAAWLMETAAYCAVNCYALISGYVNIDSKYRYSSIVLLWFRTVFYAVLISAAFYIFSPQTVGIRQIAKSFFPVFEKFYWYISEYFCLFLFIPILNKAVCSLNKKQALYICCGLVLFFSVFQTAFNNEKRDVFVTASGYSALWLAVLYIIGACIKKFGLFESMSKAKALLGYVICVLFSWGYKFFYQCIPADSVLKSPVSRFNFISYISPTVVASAVFLLILFRQLEFKSVSVKIITTLSPLTLSVYLIHVHPLVWESPKWHLFTRFLEFPTAVTVLCVIGSALAIFIIGCAVDLIREKLFKLLKLKKHLIALEDKIIGNVWAESVAEHPLEHSATK